MQEKFKQITNNESWKSISGSRRHPVKLDSTDTSRHLTPVRRWVHVCSVDEMHANYTVRERFRLQESLIECICPLSSLRVLLIDRVDEFEGNRLMHMVNWAKEEKRNNNHVAPWIGEVSLQERRQVHQRDALRVKNGLFKKSNVPFYMKLISSARIEGVIRDSTRGATFRRCASVHWKKMREESWRREKEKANDMCN